MRATEPGRQSPGFITCGRRSIAVNRANVSRASGPASRSAPNPVVMSSAPAGASPPRISARVGVIGSHVASPSTVARPNSSGGQLALQFVLADVGGVGEPDRAQRVRLARVGHRHVPAVTGLELRAGRARLALHRRARDGVRRARAQELEAHERRTSPSGSKNGEVVTVAVWRAASSEIVIVVPSTA